MVKIIIHAEPEEAGEALSCALNAIENSSFSGGFALYGKGAETMHVLWVVKENKNSYTVRKNGGQT